MSSKPGTLVIMFSMPVRERNGINGCFCTYNLWFWSSFLLKGDLDSFVSWKYKYNINALSEVGINPACKIFLRQGHHTTNK